MGSTLHPERSVLRKEETQERPREDGGGDRLCGHQPRDAGSLQELEEARAQTLPRSSLRTLTSTTTRENRFVWFEATQLVTICQSGHGPPVGWASSILPLSHWDTPRARPCTQGPHVNHTAPLSSHRLGWCPGGGGGTGETLGLDTELCLGRTSWLLGTSRSPLLGPWLPQLRACACHCDGDQGWGEMRPLKEGPGGAPSA